MTDHLPEAERPWVRRKLRAAWANPNAREAEAALNALAAQLERVNADAAASAQRVVAEVTDGDKRASTRPPSKAPPT